MPLVYVLFGAAFTVAVSLALGQLLFRALRLDLFREEEHPLAFVAGAACLSLLVFLLAAAGQAKKGVFLAVGCAAIGVALLRGAFRPAPERLPPLERSWRWLFGVVFAVFAAYYFIHALAPEKSPDGSAYHLGLVSRYYAWHGFRPITTSLYANLSQGMEMLYLFAWAFGRHSAAALVHFVFLVSVPWLMLSLARRFGFGPAGAAGALFFFLSPVAAIDGTVAYNDVAVAAVVFTVFYFVQVWSRAPDLRLLVPAGLCAGFAYALKYTAFLAVVYALGFVAWRQWRARRPLLRPLALVAVCALAMMLPWMIKNAVWLGNPFSPFFNALFPNPYVHVSFEQEYARHMRHYEGITSCKQIPLEVTKGGERLCGFAGPLFLLAPIALGALVRGFGRQLLLAWLVFTLTYAANIGTRFLIPGLPFLSLAMAAAVWQWGPRPRRDWSLVPLVFAHAILSWPNGADLYCGKTAWRLHGLPWKAALRIEAEEEYLARTLPEYRVARMIERVVPPGSRVLTFQQVAQAYTGRDIVVVYESGEGQILGQVLWTGLIAGYQPTREWRFQSGARTVRKLRAVQTARLAEGHWSVFEMRVFQDEKEVLRSPQWRLRAEPLSWDVQAAFDGNPATRWASWQAAEPGMFLEIEFPEPATVDRAVLLGSGDEHEVRLRLEYLDTEGRWFYGEFAPEVRQVAPPRNLRRWASSALKLRGIDYLLVAANDYGAADYAAHAEEWGFTLAGEVGGIRLYSIALSK